MNYTVRVSLEVCADNAEQAMDAVADVIKLGYGYGGISPVATFDVAEGAPQILDKLDKGKAINVS